MTDFETGDRDAFVLMLRSKTALGRLNDLEVHAVIDFLEAIGFAQTAPVVPAPVDTALVAATAPAVMTPAVQMAAQLAQVLPPPSAAPLVSGLASLESIIEKDVKAFFEPAPQLTAPIAPPPGQ